MYIYRVIHYVVEEGSNYNLKPDSFEFLYYLVFRHSSLKKKSSIYLCKVTHIWFLTTENVYNLTIYSWGHT